MRSEVIHGDAVEVLQALIKRPGYDPRDVVMIADPPWVGYEHVEIHGAGHPAETWLPVAVLSPKVARRLILWLGRNSDPLPMLSCVPRCPGIPFKTIVTLRMVPPGHHGCFEGGDLAYVFADKMRVPEGQHCLPATITDNGPESARARRGLEHPCPRNLGHARGLLRWYAARATLIVDPFCGSGTIGAAAAELGLDYIGIDSDLRWVEESRERIDATIVRVSRQVRLDFTPAEQLDLGGLA